MKKLFTIIILTLFATTAMHSQSNRNNSLGEVTKITSDKTEQTFNFETTNGTARITIFTPNIIRVRIAKSFGPDYSHVVVGKVVRGNFDYGEDRNNYYINTDSLDVVISKKPLRITFKTKKGEVINSDDPAFGTSWLGTEVTTYKTLQEGEKFLGLGMKTGHLDRRGEAFVNWNTDNPHYDSNSDPLYSSIPFYIGLHNGLRYGIFLDNSHRTVFNFAASNNRFSYFSADDGEMDYYFIWHKNVADIIKSYTWLTGRMELPPLWALGFQQSRWSYTPDSEVLRIANTFREKKIPADVIYLDIDYMDQYKIFTWHPENFPDPKKLLDDLKALNFKTAVIVDPGIKVEEGYEAYDEGLAQNHFVKYPDGRPWTAQVWPGWCHFPDFTQSRTREWWGKQFEGYVNLGIEGFWNDMNEIATWGQQPPNMLEFGRDGNTTTYREAKNIYGMEMARATLEGTKKLMNGRRLLNITRAGFAGLQRYTAIWTGDNQATDDHLMLSVKLVNSLGLSGVSFAGSDVGGFGGDATPDLFARWIQVGAFTPFFRAHSANNTRSAEPWTYGEQTECIARNYIQLRYNLLPYVYAGMRESTISGMPMNRSLAIDFTDDEKVFWRIYEAQYMFGPSLLVVPVESTKHFTKVYLPEGGWYDFYTDRYFNGKEEIIAESPINKLPVFAKAGSMIPMQSSVQYAGEHPGDTLIVHLYRSYVWSDLEWNYYEDDGNTYNYVNGDYYLRSMRYKPAINEVVFGEKRGNLKSKFKHIRLVFHGFQDLNLMPKLDGKPRRIESYTLNFQYAAENPKAKLPGQLTCPSIIFPNEPGNIVIGW
jgi:alpha-glucosidase